jgi:hypothetical protein
VIPSDPLSREGADTVPSPSMSESISGSRSIQPCTGQCDSPRSWEMTYLDGLEGHVHPGEIARIGQDLGTDEHGNNDRLNYGKEIGQSLLVSTNLPQE